MEPAVLGEHASRGRGNVRSRHRAVVIVRVGDAWVSEGQHGSEIAYLREELGSTSLVLSRSELVHQAQRQVIEDLSMGFLPSRENPPLGEAIARKEANCLEQMEPRLRLI